MKNKDENRFYIYTLKNEQLHGLIFGLGLIFIVFQTCQAGISCPAGTWSCNNAIQCINSTLRCNGLVDCTDGSDEGSTCSKISKLSI